MYQLIWESNGPRGREDSMKRKRHTPQKIIAKLREAEVDLNQGATIEAVCRKLEISEQTVHRWRHLYGGWRTLVLFKGAALGIDSFHPFSFLSTGAPRNP